MSPNYPRWSCCPNSQRWSLPAEEAQRRQDDSGQHDWTILGPAGDSSRAPGRRKARNCAGLRAFDRIRESGVHHNDDILLRDHNDRLDAADFHLDDFGEDVRLALAMEGKERGDSTRDAAPAC